MAQTGIIVPLPDAEPVIGSFRREHTEGGARGAPAHVTLLFPFTDTAALTAERLRRVGEIVGSVPAFDVSLVATAYFAGTPRILYLRPEPDTAFRDLTAALVAAFPEHPPYEGAFADVIPHATVAMTEDAAVLERIEAEVAQRLPIVTHVTEAALIVHDEAADRWTIRERLPLG
jgi:2'-5' RNA ligase